MTDTAACRNDNGSNGGDRKGNDAAAPLVLGIGCRRGVSVAQIENAVQAALDGLALADVGAIATVDAKANEPALVAFCAKHAVPLRVFERERLAAVATVAPPSAAARAHLRIDGVCEPCALLGAGSSTLVRGKLALDGVTVAVASRVCSETNFSDDRTDFCR